MYSDVVGHYSWTDETTNNHTDSFSNKLFNDRRKKGLFDDLADKETVILFLSKYHVDSVPSDIGRLKNTKRLYITDDSVGWTIYPPLSALPQSTNSTPGKKLPTEITELTGLKYLGLVHLNLESLPEDFNKGGLKFLTQQIEK